MTDQQRNGAGSWTRRRCGVLPVAGLGLGLAALLTLTGCGTSHPATAAPSSADSYGSLPTFLPSSAIVPDSTLTGSAQRPALTTEGDSVVVHLADGSLTAQVTGPDVPGEGLPYQTPADTCTFTLTLSHASTSMPISPNQFNTLDHLGAVYHLAAVPDEPAPPASIAPGQTLTFQLRTVMPTGEGLLRFAPDGKDIVASWDFVVEND